jgi:hypothetical protein
MAAVFQTAACPDLSANSFYLRDICYDIATGNNLHFSGSTRRPFGFQPKGLVFIKKREPNKRENHQLRNRDDAGEQQEISPTEGKRAIEAFAKRQRTPSSSGIESSREGRDLCQRGALPKMLGNREDQSSYFLPAGPKRQHERLTCSSNAPG